MEEDKLELSQELLEELKDDLHSLLCRYDYNRNGSDWECVFCGERPYTNGSEIPHRNDCLGKKLEKALW